MFAVLPLWLFDVVDWTALIAVSAAAALLAVLAAVRRHTVLTLSAAILLAVALLLAALPSAIPASGVIVGVTVFALIAAVAGGDPVTRAILSRTTFDQKVGAHGGLLAEDGRELLRGGQMIGVLERFAVAGVIVAGFPDALAVIIAIKGVGRFSDLENSAVRERFIIGTFASWIWASVAACVVLLLRT